MKPTKGTIWTIEDGPWSYVLGHVLGEYPREACGILFSLAKRPFHITEARPAENVTSEDPSTRYVVDPLELLAAYKRAEETGLDICGFYHSHPEYPAVPSEYDRNYAWEGYLYLILSIQDGILEECRAWTWDPEGQRFSEAFIRLFIYEDHHETPSPSA